MGPRGWVRTYLRTFLGWLIAAAGVVVTFVTASLKADFDPQRQLLYRSDAWLEWNAWWLFTVCLVAGGLAKTIRDLGGSPRVHAGIHAVLEGLKETAFGDGSEPED